jgi:hypothetical protein
VDSIHAGVGVIPSHHRNPHSSLPTNPHTFLARSVKYRAIEDSLTDSSTKSINSVQTAALQAVLTTVQPEYQSKMIFSQ